MINRSHFTDSSQIPPLPRTGLTVCLQDGTVKSCRTSARSSCTIHEHTFDAFLRETRSPAGDDSVNEGMAASVTTTPVTVMPRHPPHFANERNSSPRVHASVLCRGGRASSLLNRPPPGDPERPGWGATADPCPARPRGCRAPRHAIRTPLARPVLLHGSTASPSSPLWWITLVAPARNGPHQAHGTHLPPHPRRGVQGRGRVPVGRGREDVLRLAQRLLCGQPGARVANGVTRPRPPARDLGASSSRPGAMARRCPG